MTRFALTNCNNFLTPECAIKASKGRGQPFELRGYIGLVYRIDHPIERFIKKKKKKNMKYKQFDEYMYLRILWCRTGCESACQQSTYNLKREQFFFYTVNYLHYWHNDESISLILFFFVKLLLNFIYLNEKNFVFGK